VPNLKPLPVLYSFRRCPYAMRARMIVAYSEISVEIREIVFKDKPDEMLVASPKGTVPVLILDDDTVLDESLDIMSWALSKNDHDNMNLPDVTNYLDNDLIAHNDNVFKIHLDHYKYADRFPAYDVEYYRAQGEEFLEKLDKLLSRTEYLMGEKVSVVDVAIFPFIRQFAFVDKNWFDQSRYSHLRGWLEKFIESDMFKCVMTKLPQWHSGDDMILFPFERDNND